MELQNENKNYTVNTLESNLRVVVLHMFYSNRRVPPHMNSCPHQSKSPPSPITRRYLFLESTLWYIQNSSINQTLRHIIRFLSIPTINSSSIRNFTYYFFQIKKFQNFLKLVCSRHVLGYFKKSEQIQGTRVIISVHILNFIETQDFVLNFITSMCRGEIRF